MRKGSRNDGALVAVEQCLEKMIKDSKTKRMTLGEGRKRGIFPYMYKLDFSSE